MGLIVQGAGGSTQELRGITAEEVLEVSFAGGASIDNLAIASANIVRFLAPSGGGAVTVNGVTSKSIDGRPLKIIAGPGATVTVVANAGTSAAANRFAAGSVIAAGSGAAYTWDHVTGQWVSTSGGGGGGLVSPLTTKGDLWGFAATNARVPVGANGTVPTADSTQADGISYQSPSTFFGQPNFTTPPAAAGWTWQANQGGAIVTPQYNAKVINVAYPPQGALAGVNWPGLFAQNIALGSPTFTLTACLSITPPVGGTDPYAGIYWRDNIGGTFQVYVIDMRNSQAAFSSYRFTTVGTLTSTYISLEQLKNTLPLVGFPIWLRAQRVAGGNVTLSYSLDGFGFNALAAADAANFVAAPNEIGLTFINDNVLATDAVNTQFTNLYSWAVGP